MYSRFLLILSIFIFFSSNLYAFNFTSYCDTANNSKSICLTDISSEYIKNNKFHYLSIEEIVFISILNSLDNSKNTFNLEEYKIARSVVNEDNPNLFGVKIQENNLFNYVNRDFLITVEYLSNLFLSGYVYYKVNDRISLSIYTDALYRMTEMLYGYYNYRDGINVYGSVRIKF